jgi:hypothetical protein
MSSGNGDLQSRYEFNSAWAERIALLIIAGLAVDIIAAFLLGKSWLEIVLNIVANLLIIAGVWGELRFSRYAKEAADAMVAEANARFAAVELRVANSVTRVLNNRAFIEQMSAFKGLSVDVIACGGSTEINQIARLLSVALNVAGWQASVWQESSEPAFTSFTLWVREGSDPRAMEAARLISNTFTSIDIWGIVSLGSGGTLVDWAAPVRMPDGTIRDASKNAPIRIRVGSPMSEPAKP